MKTIWKFALPSVTWFNIDIPAQAQVLHVGAQDNEICLWALVDTDNPVEMRRFYVFGTGHPISTEVIKHAEYVGTAQMPTGLVWHVWRQL